MNCEDRPNSNRGKHGITCNSLLLICLILAKCLLYAIINDPTKIKIGHSHKHVLAAEY